MTRKPVVSGKFYAGDSEDLKIQIKNCFLHPAGPGTLPVGRGQKRGLSGLIVPHAGYMASGPVAAWGYYEASLLVQPAVVVIVGPNHTGLGTRLSLWTDGAWSTPFGEVDIDEDLCRKLIENSNGLIQADTSAHLYEHSIEVQLPFLQYVYSQISLVPIVMTDQRLELALILADIIKKSIGDREDMLIIASSYLNHYESHEKTMKKDSRLVQLLVEGKYEEAYSLTREERISACGLGPMVAVRSLFTEMNVLKNTSSGEIIGDRYRTVGYLASILR